MFATEPPAAAPLSALDRRTLLKGGILGLGVAGAPLAAQSGGKGFSHGVASGEPAAERAPGTESRQQIVGVCNSEVPR